ncbi:hypothetical protein ACJIZ3_001182 [Penstemon smallii]|uniref:Uncharacterized protein n=1 Tax=Penstemon smallii TaxID=265156 RepID=A0ABD3U2V2_9LAMI
MNAYLPIYISMLSLEKNQLDQLIFPTPHRPPTREQCNLSDAMVILGVKGGLKNSWFKTIVGDDHIMCCTIFTDDNKNPTLERRRYWTMSNSEYADVVLVHYRVTEEVTLPKTTRNPENETNEDPDSASALALSILSKLEYSDSEVSSYYELCAHTFELNIEGQHSGTYKKISMEIYLKMVSSINQNRVRWSTDINPLPIMLYLPVYLIIHWICSTIFQEEYEDIVLVHYRDKEKDRSTPLLSSSESTRNPENETNEDPDYASGFLVLSEELNRGVDLSFCFHVIYQQCMSCHI